MKLTLIRDIKFLFCCALIAGFSVVCDLPVSAQVIEVDTVYARSATPVYTQPLFRNVDYEFTCKGTFSFWRDANGDSVGLVDAAYNIDIPEGEFGNGLEPLPATASNGFLINNRTVTGMLGLIGVSPTNTYRVPLRGNGTSAGLFIEDKPPFGVDRHSDNTGFILVEVRRVSPNVSVNPKRIDFGDVVVGSNKDSSVIFHNGSRSGLQVNLSNIIGPNATDFSVLGNASFTIYENQDSTVDIRFTPSSIGKRYGALLFNTNDPANPQVRIDLEGNGVAPTISVSPSAIDFGEVDLGMYADTTLVVRNTGTAPLTVQTLTINGNDPGEFSYVSPSSFILPAGQQRAVTLRFTPTSILRKDAFFNVGSNAGGLGTTSIALTGVGVTTLTAGFLPDNRGAVEDIVRLPVELFENRAGSNTTSFQFLAKYNYRILYPRRVLNANTLSQTFNVQFTSPRAGALSVTGTNGQPLTGTGTLLYLEFFVLFGDTTESLLIMDSLRFNNGNPRARIRNGIFYLDSACNQFLRQVIEVGVAKLRQNSPNPFNPSTTISYFIPVDQRVRLHVYDMLGRNAAVLVDEYQKAGDHNVEFIPPNLTSGIYYYSLHSMDGLLTRRMLLLR